MYCALKCSESCLSALHVHFSHLSIFYILFQIALLRDGERDVEDARRSSTRKTSKVMSVTKSSTGFETKLSNSSRARR